MQVPYLAFADDLAILADDEQTATKQIEILEECANKVGLHISYEKTKFMATRTNTNKLITKNGEICKVEKFKYLGEFIESTGLEKSSQIDRLQKTRRYLGITQNLYNKKSLSRNTKIRHYNTVVKPAVLYASETLSLNRKGDLENIKKEERKIIRKILGPRKTAEGYRLQHNQVVETHSNIELDMRKRRLKFYGHIRRLPENRLTRQVVEYLIKLKQPTTWIAEVQRDLARVEITETDIFDRDVFRKKIDKWDALPERTAKKPRPKWSEERKRAFAERMRLYWKDRNKMKKK